MTRDDARARELAALLRHWADNYRSYAKELEMGSRLREVWLHRADQFCEAADLIIAKTDESSDSIVVTNDDTVVANVAVSVEDDLDITPDDAAAGRAV